MRPTGDSHRRALTPAVKPHDAEAMDAGVAAAVDDKLGEARTEAGTKVKSNGAAAEEAKPVRRRG